jgi:rod shape determining protein RodA
VASWAIGLGLFFIGRQINPKQVTHSRWYLFIFSCLLLTIPIVFDHITRGSRRWLEIGTYSIQPSEIVKPLLMLFLASTSQPLLLLIPVVIIFLQPDLGSGLTVLILMAPIVLYNRKVLRIVLIACVIFIAASPIIWSKVLHDYQRHRITNFLEPGLDPLGKGYNVLQSKIAIGSGGFFGKGYKKGTQGQLLFLPEKHTDFMYAATAEELGIVGILIITSAYYILIRGLVGKAYNTTNNQPLFIFTLGIAIQIWAQVFINIGMNLGILPVTGIPLPFMSQGGSSLMALMFSIGVVYSS